MPELLTLQERQILVVAAFLLSSVAFISVPADLPYATQIRIALALAGPLAAIIQKFLAMSPDEQSAILDVIKTFAALSPEQQKNFISLLPQIAPMLQAMAGQSAPKPVSSASSPAPRIPEE